MKENTEYSNPFRPGAGHVPPYLAGRKKEAQEFTNLLRQDTVLENMILTGLRGVGKTVLLESFKPIALQHKWAWAGTDLSESASISEDNLAIRLLTDIAVITSTIIIGRSEKAPLGFERQPDVQEYRLDYHTLKHLYETSPGLVADKLKFVLEFAWEHFRHTGRKGIVFVYDEAQNLADHKKDKQYPLSVLLDVFQTLQRKGIPFMLLLTGLPTLFPKLVDTRTYSERMFHVVMLHRLTKEESREAILRPLKNNKIAFGTEVVDAIIKYSGGYPYFIQFLCREIYDALVDAHKLQLVTRNPNTAQPIAFIQIMLKADPNNPQWVPFTAIIQKLDTDFFSGRWAKATDRQRELLMVIAALEHSNEEFTVQEIVQRSQQLTEHPFSGSQVNQMLSSLSNAGLVYKNRHGKYSFAVPLFADFIKRQQQDAS